MHASVLLEEAIAYLQPQGARRYLDGTLGAGGHTERILAESSPDGQVLGLDWDDAALDVAQKRLADFGPRLITRQESYSAARKVLSEIGWHTVDGALLDLGLSS